VLKTYAFSLVFSAVCVGLALWWGQTTGMGWVTALWLVFVLGLLEISLSFDNAVVNAGVLRNMTAFWQKMFLTIGILVAVFGMRLVFPIVIVSVITGLSNQEVINMALKSPAEYSAVLNGAYPMIATFGGSFLLMVFLKFMLDPERGIHWLAPIERRLAAWGKLESMAVLFALAVVTVTAMYVDPALQYKVLLCGVSGVGLFVAINTLDQVFEHRMEKMMANNPEPLPASKGGLTEVAGRMGFSAFLYLEVLDASFSFDGVVGAFAVTRDVVIIMLGLAIGAIFVRSMTIDLVKRGVLPVSYTHLTLPTTYC
jgi:hypothetical protein